MTAAKLLVENATCPKDGEMVMIFRLFPHVREFTVVNSNGKSSALIRSKWNEHDFPTSEEIDSFYRSSGQGRRAKTGTRLILQAGSRPRQDYLAEVNLIV